MRNGLFFLLFFISPFVIGEEISFLGTDIRFDVPIMMQYSKALNTWISSDLDMVLTDSRVDVAYAEIISQIDNQPDFEILAHTNTSSSLKKNDPINGFFTLMYISGTNEYTNIINVATIEKNYNLARDMIINAKHQELDKNEINERMFFKIELNPEWSLRGWIRSDYIYTIDNHATAFADPVLKLGCNKMIWPVEGNERKSKKEYIQFLYTSKGSLAETRYHLLLAKDLEYISEEKYNSLISNAVEISKMLSALIKYLRSTN